jgi:hypothetical protein
MTRLVFITREVDSESVRKFPENKKRKTPERILNIFTVIETGNRGSSNLRKKRKREKDEEDHGNGDRAFIFIGGRTIQSG